MHIAKYLSKSILEAIASRKRFPIAPRKLPCVPWSVAENSTSYGIHSSSMFVMTRSRSFFSRVERDAYAAGSAWIALSFDAIVL